MEQSDKHQVEGLLKARAQDMRHARRPRTATALVEPPPAGGSPAHAPARTCADCSAEIPARRLRAMPRATRCLTCQRAAELAAVPT